MISIGMDVFIWSRPDHDLILLLGEGTFEGMNYINGNNFPIVKLANGKEITAHYVGVEVSSKESVQRVCKAFAGDVIQWDIDAYLAGRRPTREQRVKSTPSNTVNQLATPKTATDRLMYLKREIEIEQSKISIAQTMIDASNELIAQKRLDMTAIKKAVLDELQALDDVPDEAILAAADRIRARAVAAPLQVPALEHAQREPERDMPEIDFVKLAKED